MFGYFFIIVAITLLHLLPTLTLHALLLLNLATINHYSHGRLLIAVSSFYLTDLLYLPYLLPSYITILSYTHTYRLVLFF